MWVTYGKKESIVSVQLVSVYINTHLSNGLRCEMHFSPRVLVLKVWKPLLWKQRRGAHRAPFVCMRGRGLFVLTFGSSLPRCVGGSS